MRPNKRKAITAAKIALDKHYLSNPAYANFEAILGGEHLVYQEKYLSSALGFLLRSKKTGTVIVNDQVKIPTQKRFIIAHELGHWYLHEDVPLFNCKPEFFIQWNKMTVAIEQEANFFAAEFLMPTIPFKAFCQGKVFSKKLIIELAEYFNVGIQAVAIRFADIGSEDIMIVKSTDRRVTWSCASDNFPWAFYDSKFRVPESSVTDEIFDGDNQDEKDEIEARKWFLNEHSDLTDLYLYEEVIPMPNYDSCLTFLYQSEKNL